MEQNVTVFSSEVNIGITKVYPRRSCMLTVTTTAKEKFEEALQSRTTDPEIAVRIISSPSKPNQLELVLDREKEGDQAVRTEEGRKVLVIGADLIPALEEMVVDYKETPKGIGFTISKPASST
jgi:Fe-S cluster assembly iron-binding protein IscA